jgi:hypothetical protein
MSLADSLARLIAPHSYAIPAPSVYANRSPKWPEVEKQHLKSHPACVVTGALRNVEVHHVLPFHLYPEFELEFWNLRTVTRDMHFLYGHCRNWSWYNPHFDADVRLGRQMLLSSLRVRDEGLIDVIRNSKT